VSGEPQDLTPEEIEALEELADLQDTDPALFEQTIREGVVEAERQEHGEFLLDMYENSTQRRQEQGRELLDLLSRAHQTSLGDDAA
jgi:hypothetical protein